MQTETPGGEKEAAFLLHKAVFHLLFMDLQDGVSDKQRPQSMK